MARGSHRSVGHVAMVLEVGDGDGGVVGEEAVRGGGVVEAAGWLRGEVAGRRQGDGLRRRATGAPAAVGAQARSRGRDGAVGLVPPIPIWIGGVGGESEWGRECVVGGLGFQDVGG